MSPDLARTVIVVAVVLLLLVLGALAAHVIVQLERACLRTLDEARSLHTLARHADQDAMIATTVYCELSPTSFDDLAMLFADRRWSIAELEPAIERAVAAGLLARTGRGLTRVRPAVVPAKPSRPRLTPRSGRAKSAMELAWDDHVERGEAS